jgi:pimeloyl-ACP methyl ester carboxylesterase
MLAQLLRLLLLTQVLTGLVLGGLIVYFTEAPSWLIPLTALLMPVLVQLSVAASTAFKSRASRADGLWWRSLVFECLAMLRVFVLQMPWAKVPSLQRGPAALPQRLPVLLVHGYVCNHRAWDAMAVQLRQAGHPVLAIDLEPLFTSIDDYAELVEQAVAALCRQTGSPQVALIGHSMGGLAIRAWLRAHGRQRVARVLTLGTPHVGTKIHAPFASPNGAQMAWHSDWLQALAASESAATRALMRIALTPQDNIVFPQTEQVLPGVPVTVFVGLGHVELMLHPAVRQWVLQQLEETAREAS